MDMTHYGIWPLDGYQEYDAGNKEKYHGDGKHKCNTVLFAYTFGKQTLVPCPVMPYT